MSKIQEDVIPVLLPFSQGEWSDLTEAERLILIRWITLFSMSGEFKDRQSVCVSQEEREAFSQTDRPSKNWSIAIGNGNPVRHSDEFFHRALELAPNIPFDGNRKSQITGAFFGNLLWFSFYSECFDDAYFFISFCRHNNLIPIFPLSNEPLVKPEVQYNNGDLRLLVPAFSESIENRYQWKFRPINWLYRQAFIPEFLRRRR